ncbi:hypothetical protein DQ393_14120 [Rhizobium tropici]|uniref:Uncharacterized protein n=1 Tax=Rhizobium tropici TaxID=398 RepID=A0A329YAQ6_RHITR|nr:hypothetical protein DQ393_14120 [Rhizobium tropici]
MQLGSYPPYLLIIRASRLGCRNADMMPRMLRYRPFYRDGIGAISAGRADLDEVSRTGRSGIGFLSLTKTSAFKRFTLIV